MGIRRFLDVKNWYSNDIILLLRKIPHNTCDLRVHENHKFKIVDYENYKDTQEFEGKGYEYVYKSFLDHGDIGVFGYVDGRCAGRCWGKVKPTDVEIGGINLGLQEDSIYVNYVEVDKKYRGIGLGKECVGELVRICEHKMMYVTIDIDNNVSLSLHKSFDFREIGIIIIQKRLLRQKSKIYMMEPIA